MVNSEWKEMAFLVVKTEGCQMEGGGWHPTLFELEMGVEASLD